MTINLAQDQYDVEPMLEESFADLSRWVSLESHGKWEARDKALHAEWISNSPSLFLKQKITAPYLWQIRATRLLTDEAFLQRFSASKHTVGAVPGNFYNFNFWLRVDSPDGGDFFQQYPGKLGNGWNGMGDDYWHSFFTTVVRNPETDWCRLRRSPGYEMMCDIAGRVPPCNYGEPHDFAFVVADDYVRTYCDNRLVYDYREDGLYRAGYIGLCVWMCKMKFEQMRLYRLLTP